MESAAETGHSDRIRVKFMTKAPADYSRSEWLNRFPGNRPSWGCCDFTFDANCQDYDWLVVYDDLPAQPNGTKRWEESLACSREQTLLITTEPSSIKPYGHGFLKQFGYVLTSQEPWCVRHPGAHYSQPGLIWFYGNHGVGASHDYLITHSPEAKTKTIATVCSSKQQKHTLHNDRHRFTQRLKADLPEMDVFGHGVRYIDDKSEALDAYRYHLAIENHICAHHWTEKLSDCYLGMTLPFYYGCPNLTDYFPAESFLEINIFEYEQACEQIQRAIVDDFYSQRLSAIREARRLFLESYCTFALVSSVVEKYHKSASVSLPPSSILSRHAWRNRSLLNQLTFVFEKCYFRGRHSLFKQFKYR